MTPTLGLLVLLHSLFSWHYFEGSITYQVQMKATSAAGVRLFHAVETNENILFIKKNKYRCYRNDMSISYPMFDGTYEYLINDVEQTVIKTIWEGDSPKVYSIIKTKSDSIKQVLGYPCHLYNGVAKDGTKYKLWITDKLYVTTTDNRGFLDKDLGVALEILVTTNHLTVHYKAYKIDSTHVAESNFRVPKGFRIEEFSPKNITSPQK